MDLGEVNLEELARNLRQHVPPNDPPVGWLRGRSYFRDVIVHLLHCSDLEAEDLVDTLEANGYLKFVGNPSEPSVADSRWTIDPHDQ